MLRRWRVIWERAHLLRRYPACQPCHMWEQNELSCSLQLHADGVYCAVSAIQVVTCLGTWLTLHATCCCASSCQLQQLQTLQAGLGWAQAECPNPDPLIYNSRQLSHPWASAGAGRLRWGWHAGCTTCTPTQSSTLTSRYVAGAQSRIFTAILWWTRKATCTAPARPAAPQTFRPKPLPVTGTRQNRDMAEGACVGAERQHPAVLRRLGQAGGCGPVACPHHQDPRRQLGHEVRQPSLQMHLPCACHLAHAVCAHGALRLWLSAPSLGAAVPEGAACGPDTSVVLCGCDVCDTEPS